MRDPSNRAESSSPPERVVGRFHALQPGATLVVVGAIHGNEPAGVKAAQRVCKELERSGGLPQGDFVALVGNTRASARDVRYIDRDLNRHWFPENIPSLAPRGNGDSPLRAATQSCAEDLELQELLTEMESAFARARGEVFLLDLHTTSGEGSLFATIGDTLRNRSFALHFPVPIVLGLEEELQGTMLEYVNSLGHVTMGFEAGQHEKDSSTDNHEALIWTALVITGLMDKHQVPGYKTHHDNLSRSGQGSPRVFEIRYRHGIHDDDGFKMEPGFKNFQRIRKGQVLARDRNGIVQAPEGGLLLMPLYQGLGDDGFFIGRSVKRLWLGVSAALRKIRLGRLVALMPGIQHHPEDPDSLLVDTRVARVYPVEVFHLLGFRRRRWIGDQLVVSRRRHDMARGD